MIIDYDFRDKRVTIVGGGHETARKIRSFLQAGARVRLVGPKFDEEARRVAEELGVPIVSCQASYLLRLAFSRADVVAVIADSPALGRKLRPFATRRRVLFYAGDNPSVSDWIQPAVRFAGPLVIAVSTGGASPIVARELAQRLSRHVRTEDRLAIVVQSFARDLARREISGAAERRRALNRIYRDREVRAALARGDVRRAKERARRILREAGSRRRTRPGVSIPR